MSKQFPVATMTMLILSACCSALPQGAVAMDTPSSGISAAPPATSTTASAPVVAPPVNNTSSVAATPAAHSAVTAVAAPNGKNAKASTTVAIQKAAVSPASKSVVRKKTGPKKAATARKITATSSVAATQNLNSNLPDYNRPYQLDGKTITPLNNSSTLRQRGDATWYNRNKQGKPTANGEIYDPYGLTAAHPTLPIPSYARVTNLSTGKSIVVRINDRGPEDAGNNHKIIELSFSAANKIGLVSSTNRKVEVRGLENDQPTPAYSKSSIAFHLKRERKDSKTATITNPAAPASGVYLQLGAFRSQSAAERYAEQIRPKLSSVTPLTPKSLRDNNLYRLWLGPYPSNAEAQRAAEALIPQLGFKPLLKTQTSK